MSGAPPSPTARPLLRESPLDGLGGMGQGAHGQIPQREDPGARQRLRLPCLPSALGVWQSGRDRAHLQQVACPLVGVPLEGCREAEPLFRGCHWEAAPGPAPGPILADWPGVEVPGDFLRGSCGGVLWCQVPHDSEHRPRGEGPARGGVYTWMVHCGRARRTRDAWSTPRTMSVARTSTIPEGSTMIPSAGPPWRPRVCKATAACPAWATRLTASWMFTLPRAVSSRIQPCATQ